MASLAPRDVRVYSRATPCGLTRGGFLGKFVVKSLERPTERVALGTLLHRLPRPIHPKTSPCKPLAGGLRRGRSARGVDGWSTAGMVGLRRGRSAYGGDGWSAAWTVGLRRGRSAYGGGGWAGAGVGGLRRGWAGRGTRRRGGGDGRPAQQEDVAAGEIVCITRNLLCRHVFLSPGFSVCWKAASTLHDRQNGNGYLRPRRHPLLMI